MTPKPAKAVSNEFAPLADELGALEKDMAPYAQKLARIDALRKALRAACPAKAEETWTITGTRFIAILGPRALERSIDLAKLVKVLGAKVFAGFATCTLKTLEEKVSPAVVASVVTSDATGSRSLKTFERGGT